VSVTGIRRRLSGSLHPVTQQPLEESSCVQSRRGSRRLRLLLKLIARLLVILLLVGVVWVVPVS
jgi:hypothetical protein